MIHLQLSFRQGSLMEVRTLLTNQKIDDLVNYTLQAALIQDINDEINGNCAHRLSKMIGPITKIGRNNPLQSNNRSLDKRYRVTVATQGMQS